MALAVTAVLVAAAPARADDTFALEARGRAHEEPSRPIERRATRDDLGPDGRTRPVPALIAGGVVLNLVGASGLIASSFALLMTKSDDTAAIAGGAAGVGLGFAALGAGTAMVIIGSPRRVASTVDVVVHPSGAAIRWSF